MTRTRDFVFTLQLARKEGRRHGPRREQHFAVVHPGSAAEDCGLRVGDSIKAVDGRPLEGLLTASLVDKDHVELKVLRKAWRAFETVNLKSVAAEMGLKTQLTPGSPISVKAAFRRVDRLNDG